MYRVYIIKVFLLILLLNLFNKTFFSLISFQSQFFYIKYHFSQHAVIKLQLK